MKNVQILQAEGRNFFGPSAALKVLASGFRFADGPLWHPGGYLLFSDTAANKIFQVYLNGVMHVLVHQSGGPCITFTHLSDMTGSNGLALDKSNNVVFCQHGNHGIARLEEKNLTQLCTSFNGRPFNSPNDLTLNAAGDIYFTDPPYGLKDELLNPEVFQPQSGVYVFKNNQVVLLATDLNFPNGLCFSQDEKHLFVCSNHKDEKMILKYDVDNDGLLTNKTVFANINADGLKTDIHNNVFAATREGVIILSPNGNKLAQINLPQMATNVAFGGLKKELLFITTPSTIYQVSMALQTDAIQQNKDGKIAKKINPTIAVP